MAKLLVLSLFIFSSLLTFLLSLGFAADADRKLYIVYLGALRDSEAATVDQQRSMLQQVLKGCSVDECLLVSYYRSFNGFAAKLTEEESQTIASMKGVVSVFPNTNYELHTTRSWDFLGFNETVERAPAVESDTIVGLLDSGIWPESASFADEGFGPPPKKWKGSCGPYKDFACNKKLIGARSYGLTDGTPRDGDGHGTHTASTAAGNAVKDVSLYGVAKGTARGAVPLARVAMYQVCSNVGCPKWAVLKGFDDAIADGVDLISVSLGHISPVGFRDDVIAMGALHAVQKGILTTQSAGNSGPYRGTVSSVAPWLLTVAASSTDRRIVARISLGSGADFAGNAINTFKLNKTDYPLIYMGDVNNCSKGSGDCFINCMDTNSTQGKIIFCDNPSVGIEALDAGAVGMITAADNDFALAYILPATLVANSIGGEVKSYINKTKDPRANILKSEEMKDPKAPTIVSFSSRGPNTIQWDILKPDISAPGVDILAAFSLAATMTGFEEDPRYVKYNVLSGTSMSCPHVTGAAAYVKTLHPDWSPSAIKSALLTTASAMNATNNEDAEFAYGAGEINPVKAINPGLVYDLLGSDYHPTLCKQGFSTDLVRAISGDESISCSDFADKDVKDLNYPSMAVKVEPKTSFRVNFSRTVTNVGTPSSAYKVTVNPERSPIKVTVVPDILQFRSLKQNRSFVVEVSGTVEDIASIFSFELLWSDGDHTVRSPLVVYSHPRKRAP